MGIEYKKGDKVKINPIDYSEREGVVIGLTKTKPSIPIVRFKNDSGLRIERGFELDRISLISDKIIEYDKWDSHLILFIKGHYSSEYPFLDVIKIFWAFRCGLPECGDDSFEYIGDKMYDILIRSNHYTPTRIQQEIHRELCKTYLDYYKDKSAIEKIIMVYRSLIISLPVKDDVGDILINLPEPKPEIFSKVFKGEANFNLFLEL